MPRRPKAKDGLTAGQRVALYEAELEAKRRKMVEDATEEVSDGQADRNSEVSEQNAPTNKGAGMQRAKKALAKPQYAVVKTDLSIPAGDIKPLHSMCNGPKSYGADISSLFAEIGVPYVRFDCADLAISSYAFDVSRIFKNYDADPSLAKNYDFSLSDRYIEAAYLSGAKVIFRIGESYDIFGEVSPRPLPENADILARICVNIIRHYNDRWAGGYSFDIEYFDICFGEPSSEHFEAYASLANSLKLYDEDIKVGGMSFDLFGGETCEFLRFCKKNRAPLDFISVDCFASEPEEAGKRAEELSALMKNLGFADTELILGKWCYIDSGVIGSSEPRQALMGKDMSLKKSLFSAQSDIRGAAFAAAMLARLQRIDSVKTACFFDAQPMISPFCSIADRFGEPQKPFFALRSFGELYRARGCVACDSVQNEEMAHSGVYACSALSVSGEAYIMIASFKGCGVVDLRIDGIPNNIYTADIYMLDGVKDLALADSVPISGMKKRMLLNVSEYGVVLVKLY